MTKATDEKIKSLEADMTELQITVQSQAEAIVGYVNREIDLRREITALRAMLNGASKGDT